MVRRSSVTKPLTVHLVGGLGNQLFGYAAGLVAAGSLGVPLKVDTTHTGDGKTDHGLPIADFSLSGDWNASHTPKGSNVWRTAEVGRVKSLASSHSPLLSRVLGTYHSRGGEGLRRLLRSTRPGSVIDGYFQSWDIPHAAKSFGLDSAPPLRRPSSAVQRWARRAQSERPIAVHVRRGDYVQEATFGLLDGSYYSRALSILKEDAGDRPIWLFSDEPDKAQEVLGGSANVISLSGEMDSAAEELWLMSQCDSLIIANSTFSWWGAWLSKGTGRIIAPDPWFRDGPDRSRILPPCWTRLASSWC